MSIWTARLTAPLWAPFVALAITWWVVREVWKGD